jgi:diguanylate cyclase (GGDEF)-like protein/PAS domain S-box-containing protein
MNAAAAAVLAVDDNATIRKAISMRLGAKGFNVVTAPDGPQALELFEHNSFDLVILDLQMPGMRGDEVLRRLREQYSSTQLPIIMLCASDNKTDINHSLDLGANDYVIKPGDLPILIARIRTQLALKETVARLREHSELMSDVFSLETAPSQKRNAIFPRDTAALLNRIDTGHSIPFDVLHDNTPMTCFTLTGNGTILYANNFGAQNLGYRPEHLIDRPMLDLYVTDDRPLAHENLASAAETPGRVHRWDIRHIKKNGQVVWMRNTARAVFHNMQTLVLVTCEDINDTYRLSEQLSFQSQHDDLTGLSNRKSLEQRLSQVIESAHSERTDHTLALIDLDQFKLINDTCGTDAGDELLRQIARLLKSVLRKRDTIARVSGDEFAVLIEDCSAADALSASETLRRAIESYDFKWSGRHYKLSASIGIVPINSQCDSSGTVLGMADTACFAAKDSGRNRVHVYESSSTPVVARHGEMRWATRINDALAENRFNLTFQTISPLSNTASAGVHYEILLRMREVNGEVIMPGEFLPAAERYNLSDKLDRWVISNLFSWFGHRPSELERISLCCINLSGNSIGDDNMLAFILEQFARGIVPAHKICFEITETAAIADLVQATRFIQELKDIGCLFALDDFGSGFSSLAYLKQLPVDFLKIDGSFVRDMVHNSIDCAMVRSINDIGHVMGKQTIAEFVEDGATLELLRSVGVDFAQGYEISRPMPLEQLVLLA